MNKIYKLGNEELVSKEYVDSLIKDYYDDLLMQINAIMEDTGNINRVKSIALNKRCDSFNLEELLSNNNSTEEDNGVSINAVTLTSLKEKPTSLEVKQLVEGAKAETIREVETMLNNIISTTDSISKIKDLISILDSKDALSSLNRALNNKVSKEEFNKYKSSGASLTNNDRKALNVLLHMAKNGFVDWLAEDGELNSIKNKPDALPANGGDANTVCGKSVDELVNKSHVDFIIGCDNQNYKESSVDFLYNKNNSISLSKKLEDFDKGTIVFRTGKYTDINANIGSAINESIIISSSKNSSSISNSVIKLINGVTLRDMHFTNCSISIFNDCNITDCVFDNCNIIFNGSIECNVNNNRINNSKMIFNDVCVFNIITNNIMKNSGGVSYIGAKNIILNNLEI